METKKNYWVKYANERINQLYIEHEESVNNNKDYQGVTSSVDKGCEILAKYARACKRGLIKKSEYNCYKKAIENIFFGI